MPRHSDSARLQRLDDLATLLRLGDHRTADELAEALRVSRRTLSRDIALLRERGLPIEADVGRGGGVRLHRRWSVDAITLDYRDAIDVLLSVSIAERLGSALFLKRSRSIRNRIAAAFAPAHRNRIRSLRRRILIGDAASQRVLATYRPGATAGADAVNEAFFELRRIDIVYIDEHGRRTARKVEPQFLLLSWPIWYLLAWDELRHGVRTFRIDRIQQATIDSTAFALRDEQLFVAAVEGIGQPL